jgi:hypothetical protein
VPVCQAITHPRHTTFDVFFFPWRRGGSSTQARMPTYVSILRVPQMIWVWRATVEWYWQGKTEELQLGCAVAQVVCHWPVTAEARFSPCGICGGQSGNGTGFSLTSLVFPHQYHSAVALHAHVSSGGWTVGPLMATVQRHSLTPINMNDNTTTTNNNNTTTTIIPNIKKL